jgi:hypothetical protein
VILRVFLLALAAAVYPTLLAGVIVLLSRPRPVSQLTAFLVGGMTCSVIAGLAILAVLDGSGQFDRHSQTGYPVANIVLGVISLTAGSALATRRPRRLAERLDLRLPHKPAADDRPSRTTRILRKGSMPLVVALGAMLNLPGIWYLAALAEISTSTVGTAGAVLLVLGFNVVMFTLVEVPLLGFLVAPDRTRATVDDFNAWLRDHKRQVAAGVAIAVGIYLVVKGITAAGS